jgi:hydrogenase expression/formation protein HypE
MKIGKVPNNILNELLRTLEICDSNLTTPPAIGEDTAILNFGNSMLLIGSDPITFSTPNPGSHSVIINANDIAASGGTPKWFCATVLMPPGTSEEEFSHVFLDIVGACKNINVQLIGGHSEITQTVNKITIAGTMIGVAEPSQIKPTANAQFGDDIIITKTFPIEGTYIALTTHSNYLNSLNIPIYLIKRLNKLINHSDISVLTEANIAKKHSSVHCMHDPTEGGISTALYEIADCAKAGIHIDNLSVDRDIQEFYNNLGMDPLGTIASGSLIITVNPKSTEALMSELSQSGIKSTRIGSVVARENGVTISKPGDLSILPLNKFFQDEITNIPV